MTVHRRRVTAPRRYFRALGILPRAGRDFDERDHARVPHVRGGRRCPPTCAALGASRGGLLADRCAPIS